MKKLFAIYDSKVEAYNVPVFFRTIGEAIRAVTSALSDPESDLAKYSSDYTLFLLGDYDESTAAFNLLPAPKSLGCLIEFSKLESSSEA